MKLNRDKPSRVNLSIIKDRAISLILKWPLINWGLFGFFVVFFACNIVPIFLNDYHELRLFTEFPVLKPLGADLVEYLQFSESYANGGNPYGGNNFYPPFELIFFWRFMLSGPNQSYIFMTALSILAFLAISLVYPLLVAPRHKLNPMAIFALMGGVYSYGLLFELERGQFNLLTMAFCFAAIYLFQHKPRLKVLAYLLFVISVNLKIYPIFFLLCFTDDWQDLKRNLLRWGLLLLANLAGLFILGWSVFLLFVQNLLRQLSHPTYWWAGNHSINSFVRVMLENLKSNSELNQQVQPGANLLTILFLLIYLICLVGIVWLAWHKRMTATNPYLLLIYTLGSLLIPSVSHDYKLSIFIAPVVLLFNSLEIRRSQRTMLDLFILGLSVLLSILFSYTLFMHINLPYYLTNNMPVLLAMGLITTLLAWSRYIQSKKIGAEVEFYDLV